MNSQDNFESIDQKSDLDFVTTNSTYFAEELAQKDLSFIAVGYSHHSELNKLLLYNFNKFLHQVRIELGPGAAL